MWTHTCLSSLSIKSQLCWLVRNLSDRPTARVRRPVWLLFPQSIPTSHELGEHNVTNVTAKSIKSETWVLIYLNCMCGVYGGWTVWLGRRRERAKDWRLKREKSFFCIPINIQAELKWILSSGPCGRNAWGAGRPRKDSEGETERLEHFQET